ncbi:MAG: alpha/beta hydrolase, partial [Cyanobacteria bacterium P01_C01_bin.73]
LKPFDQRLLHLLNRHAEIRCWEYSQTADEPCCFEKAIILLHDYLKQRPQPVHLIGHSLGGTLGLLYANRYPHRVKSLTLLSVGANPSVTWHAHYYALRALLPCSREMVLAQMVRLLFGAKSPEITARLAKCLARVLDSEIAPHSLVQRNVFDRGGVDAPLLVCHGAQDGILDAHTQAKWQQWLKPGDRRWQCPEGRHFFHHDRPQPLSQIVLDFWQHTNQGTHLPLVELLS